LSAIARQNVNGRTAAVHTLRVMKIRGHFVILFTFLLFFFVGGNRQVNIVHAHGLDEGQLILRLAGNVAYVDATPNLSIFAAFDDNKNTLMDAVELKRHRAEMLKLFIAGLKVSNESGVVGQVVFEDLSLSHGHASRGTKQRVNHIKATLRLQWLKPPIYLNVEYDFPKRAPLRVKAHQAVASKLLADQKPIGPVTIGQLDSDTAQIQLFRENSKFSSSPGALLKEIAPNRRMQEMRKSAPEK
jgi:hypothetical protein